MNIAKIGLFGLLVLPVLMSACGGGSSSQSITTVNNGGGGTTGGTGGTSGPSGPVTGPSGPIHICPEIAVGGGCGPIIGPVRPFPDPVIEPVAAGSTGSASTSLDGVEGGSKDVNLDQANISQKSVDNRAQALVSQFGMSFQDAQTFTRLSDRLQALNTSGQASDDQRTQLADQALATAGISDAEARDAMTAKIRDNDDSKLNALIEKGASNLGMSSAAIRQQILPQLGLSVN